MIVIESHVTWTYFVIYEMSSNCRTNQILLRTVAEIQDWWLYIYIYIYISNGLCLSTLPQRVLNTHMRGWLLLLLKKVQTEVICTTMVSWIIPIVRQSVNHKKILWVIHKQQKNYIENHKNTPQSIKKTCYNIKCTYKYHFTSSV